MRRTRGVEEVALARMTPTRGFSMLDYQPDVDTTAYPKPFATYNAVSPAVHNPLASARPTHSYRSARVGSTSDARRAGSRLAARETIKSVSATTL